MMIAGCALLDERMGNGAQMHPILQHGKPGNAPLDHVDFMYRLWLSPQGPLLQQIQYFRLMQTAVPQVGKEVWSAMQKALQLCRGGSARCRYNTEAVDRLSLVG